MTLYKLDPDNKTMVPVARVFADFKPVMDAEGRVPLRKNWKPIDLVWDRSVRKSGARPDITLLYMSRNLMFRTELQPLLFPSTTSGMEFLPVRVEGMDWTLLNTLDVIRHYEARTSVFHRSTSTGEIFFTQHLEIARQEVGELELFTLDDSNRAELFATEPFRHRVLDAGLTGLGFYPVGQVR